ncbi:MAG: response regulator [Elusimicrobiales bacterium]|jgi:two-component system alkaline phosphatase synthesis response regulator PhoP
MPIERKIVVLADDDKEFLYELREALALCGFIPIAVTTGADALKAARRVRPDVILLDLKLGDEDGFAVARRIRKEPALAETPVIMMSGYFNWAADGKALPASDINIYLAKPFTQRDVVRGIQAILAEKEEASAGTNGFDLMKHLLPRTKRPYPGVDQAAGGAEKSL